MLGVLLALDSSGRLGVTVFVALTAHVGVVWTLSHSVDEHQSRAQEVALPAAPPPLLEIQIERTREVELPTEALAAPGPVSFAAPADRAASARRHPTAIAVPAAPPSATLSPADMSSAPSNSLLSAPPVSPGASGAATPVSGAAGSGSGSTGTSGGVGARLLGAGDPCAGYFPADSKVQRGTVRLDVDVDPRGLVTGSRVRAVEPKDAGLSQAALACATRLRFKPASDGAGQPVTSRATLLLRFERP